MIKTVISQFNRMLYDDGRDDMDFEDQKKRLLEAQTNLAAATNELMRASSHLNAVVAANGFSISGASLN